MIRPLHRSVQRAFLFLPQKKEQNMKKKICRRDPDFVVADHGVNRCPSIVDRAAGSAVFRKGRVSDRSL